MIALPPTSLLLKVVVLTAERAGDWKAVDVPATAANANNAVENFILTYSECVEKLDSDKTA